MPAAGARTAQLEPWCEQNGRRARPRRAARRPGASALGVRRQARSGPRPTSSLRRTGTRSGGGSRRSTGRRRCCCRRSRATRLPAGARAAVRPARARAAAPAPAARGHLRASSTSRASSSPASPCTSRPGSGRSTSSSRRASSRRTGARSGRSTRRPTTRRCTGGRGSRASALFLASRGVRLPEGEPSDPSSAETVHGLANRKHELLDQLLADGGVTAFEGSRHYLELAHDAGVRCAVVSASAHTEEILERAGLAGLVDARVDADTIVAEHLRGRPAPDRLLAACRKLGVLPEPTPRSSRRPRRASRRAGRPASGSSSPSSATRTPRTSTRFASRAPTSSCRRSASCSSALPERPAARDGMARASPSATRLVRQEACWSACGKNCRSTPVSSRTSTVGVSVT